MLHSDRQLRLGCWALRAVALAVVAAMPAAALADGGPCEPPLTPDQCDLLVTSRITNSVLRYDGVTGDFLGEFVTAGSGGLDVPFGLTFGPDRNLYVGSGGTQRRVKRYDGESGAFLDDFTQAFDDPVSLVVFGPDGNLYALSGSRVVRVDGDTGAFIDDFADIGLGEFATSLTFGPDGNLYVSSFLGNEVLRFEATTGDFVDVFATIPLSDSEGHPGQVVFLPDGDALVGLPDEGNDILRFDGTTGDFEGPFIPELDAHPDGPLAFVLGPDGNLYVPSRDSDEVLRYDGATGDFIDLFASGGGLDEPAALVFVPEPGQALLVATGALALAAVRLRRARS